MAIFSGNQPPARALKWRTPDCEVVFAHKSCLLTDMGAWLLSAVHILHISVANIEKYISMVGWLGTLFIDCGCAVRPFCPNMLLQHFRGTLRKSGWKSQDNWRLPVLNFCRGTARRPRYKFLVDRIDARALAACFYSFQQNLVSKSVTLIDLERRNGPYFALFYRIW